MSPGIKTVLFKLKAVAGLLMLVSWTTRPVAAQEGRGEQTPTFRFQDAAAAAGIDQLTIYGGEKTNRYLLETTGCGAALFDYDGDGLLDAFLVNGARLEDDPSSQRNPVSHLYRNRGNGTFEDVTAGSGLARSGWGQAVCVGDVDNDGRDDILVTYWGQNALYLNRGPRGFQDVTQESGLLQQRKRWNSGCAFLDADNDGDLDLFVANYIDFDLETAPTPDSGLCKYKGVDVACGPPGLTGGKNAFYLNQGDGTFKDASRESGIASIRSTYALGVVTLDYNQDGWTDIYVANDSNPSVLYENQKDGTYRDVGVLAGVALSPDGKPQAGMGVAAADVDNDGLIDIYKTNFAEDTVNLYLNKGNGFFDDATFSAGLGTHTRWLGWGIGLFDFDNDALIDIFEVNGHVYPEVRNLSDSTSYRQRKVVYRNLGGGRFLDITLKAGPDLAVPQAGRGAAFGDIDNDGDIDVLVNNVNSLPNLYLNRLESDGQAGGQSGNHWIQLRLEGRRSNRSAIGAQVRLKAGDLTLIGEVRSGGSYYSQNQLRLHFGLGAASQVDWIEVRWPGGRPERIESVTPDRLYRWIEGSGKLTPIKPSTIAPSRGTPSRRSP